MPRRIASIQGIAAAVIAISLIAAAVVWLAPDERTLGGGIKSVYVHVALTWTAMAGMLAAGLLGLALAISGRGEVAAFMDAVGWVALGFFALAVPASIVSQVVNWNGIFLDEPRMQLSIRTLSVFLIVQIANRWLPWNRLRGLAMATTSATVVVALRAAPLVLHPRDPIRTSSSLAIQVTFAVLFLLCLSGAALIVWYATRRRAD